MNNVIVFTDGSCLKKSNNDLQCTGTGIGIHFPNKELPDISRSFKIQPLTNQRTELYAIYIALRNIINKLKFNKIILYTDSMYSINCITLWIYNWINNNWKTSDKNPVKNKDILLKIFKYTKKLLENKQIEFHHVKSHTGNDDYYSIHNDIVDKLANKGAKK